MKKIYIALLLLLSLVVNAQEKQIEETKKDSLQVSSMLVCSNEERSKWFIILPYFKIYNGINEKNHLTAVKHGIGKCSNRDILQFSFIDDKYMSIRAQNELDCTGILEVKFPLNHAQLETLKIKPLRSIRYINGNDRSNFSYKVTENEKNYFINILTK
jgi:hypothetical protein